MVLLLLFLLLLSKGFSWIVLVVNIVVPSMDEAWFEPPPPGTEDEKKSETVVAETLACGEVEDMTNGLVVFPLNKAAIRSWSSPPVCLSWTSPYNVVSAAVAEAAAPVAVDLIDTTSTALASPHCKVG